MPFKYIGRTTTFKGKSLWEIVGNLKNFGVGRIVCRSAFERYPESSYLKILKVETLPNPKNPSVDDLRKVKVCVERTFRGVTYPKPVLIESASYKTDYRLIPKDEEAEYCKNKIEKEEKTISRTIEFPPIMKLCLLKEMKNKGEPVDKLELPVVHRKSVLSRYHLVNEGEKPDMKIPLGLGKPTTPSLYEGIKL